MPRNDGTVKYELLEAAWRSWNVGQRRFYAVVAMGAHSDELGMHDPEGDQYLAIFGPTWAELVDCPPIFNDNQRALLEVGMRCVIDLVRRKGLGILDRIAKSVGAEVRFGVASAPLVHGDLPKEN